MFWFRFATFVLGTVALVIGLVTFTPPLLILGAGLLTTPVVSEAISWEHKQPKHKLMPPEKVAQLEKELGITPENRLATAYEENEKWIKETSELIADALMTPEEREAAKLKKRVAQQYAIPSHFVGNVRKKIDPIDAPYPVEYMTPTSVRHLPGVCGVDHCECGNPDHGKYVSMLLPSYGYGDRCYGDRQSLYGYEQQSITRIRRHTMYSTGGGNPVLYYNDTYESTVDFRNHMLELMDVIRKFIGPDLYLKEVHSVGRETKAFGSKFQYDAVITNRPV